MSETTIALLALIISVLTAVGTFVYTHQQMKAAKRANELTERAQQEQVQPYVIADIRERVPGSQLLVFVIENTGPTMARDVRLTVDPPLRSTLGEETEVTLNAAVTRSIPVLPPGRRLLFLMDVGHKLFSSDLPRQYTVVVNATGPFDAVEPLTYIIDLEVLKNSLLNRESLEWSTHVLAEEAKKSRKAHEKQANATSQLFRTLAAELEARRANSGEPPEIEPPAN
ncbi:hypothetical protein [Streptomyces hirsutus]|uniref:hypothetical protein n=1 Tax=Streptomyces hirsutus TaxID=35620 RepID=UPI00364B6AF2